MAVEFGTKVQKFIAKEFAHVNFNPMWDAVLLKPHKVTTTKGGLILPDGAKLDECPKSLVIRSGPGAYREDGKFVPNPIEVGMMVYHLTIRAAWKVNIDGILYLCVSGRDCVGTAECTDEMLNEISESIQKEKKG